MVKRIKEYSMAETNRSRLDLSGGLRLDPQGYLEIAPVGGSYPTTANLYAKTWVSMPRSTGWLGFEADYTQPKSFENAVVSTPSFRLSRDGIEELYWDGGAWSAATPGDWSTEQEVADNISSLPLASGFTGLQVIVSIQTSDVSQSARVTRMKVLYETDTEDLEDVIARGLSRFLRNNIKPIGRADYSSDGTAIVNLLTTTQYAVSSVESVYNLSSDPDMLTNLFQSYNSGNGDITLTGAPTLGDRIRVNFKYSPAVSIVRSQDYTEVKKLPVLIISGVRSIRETEIPCGERVANKGNNTAWHLTTGQQIDLYVSIDCIGTKEIDAYRMGESVRKTLRLNQLLLLPGPDEYVRIHVWDERDGATIPSQQGVYSSKVGVRILGAVFYDGDAVAVNLVGTLTVQGDLNLTV